MKHNVLVDGKYDLESYTFLRDLYGDKDPPTWIIIDDIDDKML